MEEGTSQEGKCEVLYLRLILMAPVLLVLLVLLVLVVVVGRNGTRCVDEKRMKAKSKSTRVGQLASAQGQAIRIR